MTGTSPIQARIPRSMRFTPALTPIGAAVLGGLLLAPAAFAADGEDTRLDLPADTAGGTAAKAAGGASASGGIVRTIVGLAVVLAVIYGLHWVLKQVKASREGTASGAGLTALASLPLGPNRSLHLVRAGTEIVLVGAGEGAITPIRTYSEAEARALGLLEDEPLASAGAPAADRAGWLTELRRRTVIR
jgi:flagellar protein FliO/FliZ